MMKKLRIATFKFLDILVILTMVLASPMNVSAAPTAQDLSPALTVDKSDYAPGESAHVTGTGFTPGDYQLTASGPDGQVDWGNITANETGDFATDSPALGSAGTYELSATAVGESTVIASVGFTVTAPPAATEPPTEAPTATEPPTVEPTQPPTDTATPTDTLVPTNTSTPTDTPTPLPPTTIQSDKADYQPGELVTLTGTNWQGDTTVSITVDDDLGKNWYYTDRAAVQADGTITDTFNLPTLFVAQYYVKATGTQTGRVANTSFTDSQEDYKHYADKAPANWQNGTLQSTNSQYFEGEVVPHYWKTDGLVPGQFYGFNVYYDYYDPSSGGYCGFDYMAQYNTSRFPPPVGNSPSPVSSIPGGPGALYAVGAQISSLSGPINFGVQRFVQIGFLATQSRAEFYWGFHLAQPGALSGCQGSKAWPGASLQTDVRATPQFTPFMLGGGGSLQINPKDVIRGTISGFKWNDLNGNGGPDAGEPRLSGWTIRLCSDPNCATVLQTATTDANGNYNFNVAPGTYFVREVQQPGWSQTYPGSIYYGATITATTPTYSNFNFGNRQGSSITIVKDAVPNDSQDFQFTGTFGSFLLDDDSDPALSNSRVFGNLSPGSYTVAEVFIPDEWVFNEIKCIGDNGNTFVPPGSNQVNIILDPGENITCTFTNTKSGHIIIDKVTNPSGDLTSFNFDANGGTIPPFVDFNLTDTDPPANQLLKAGNYSVSENLPAGWTLEKASCFSSIGDTETPANIELDAGETVTCTFTNSKQNPLIQVVKSSTTTEITTAGQLVPYTFTVTNTGNVMLTGITVTDPNCDAAPAYQSGDDNADSKLQLNETWIYTCNHTVTQGEIDSSGASVNLAWGANTSESSPGWGGGSYPGDITDGNTYYTDTWAHGLAFTGGTAGYGGACGYRQATVNLGVIKEFRRVLVWHHGGGHIPTVYGVDYWDGSNWLPVEGSSFVRWDLETSSGWGSVPTETIFPTVTGSKVRFWLNNCNIEHGWIYEFEVFNTDNNLSNTVTADSNESEPDTDTYQIPITQTTSMTVEKSSTTTELTAPATVTYSFLVTNTGNLTLTGISLTDDNDNDDMSCPSTTLAVGTDMTCTATHTFTQAELDAGGTLDNTVTASSNEAPDATDDLSIPITQNASMTVEKSSATTSLSAPATVTYNYLVTNTGNVTLTGISLADDNDNDDMSCPFTTLAPAGTMSCTATHTFTQAELDANGSPTADSGVLFNQVTASSNEAPDATDDLSIPITQNASMTVEKSSATTSLSAPAVVTYSYLVTNTGNVTLTGISLSDDNDNDDMSCPSPTLAVGTDMTCTATHTFSQAELDAGGTLDNIVRASSNEAPDATDDLSVPIVQNPSLMLVKSGTFDAGADGFADVGELITYTFVVTNTGNVTLINVTVTDPLPGLSTITCDGTTIPVGSFITCNATYAVTQDDIDGGFVHNLATADSDESGPDTDDETVALPQNHAFTVSKTANPTSMPEPGGPVTFTVIVNNTGNTTLSLTSLQDNVYGNVADNTNTDINSTTCSVPQTILVGTFYECTFNANITGQPGFYTDIVTATANDVTGFDDATVQLTDVAPSITVDKSADPITLPEPGGNVEFTVVVTNNSFETVTLTSLVDDVYGDLNEQGTCATGGTIAAGDSYTCTFTGAVSGEPGFYTDTVTAVATDNDGTTDEASDSATVELTDVAPTVTIDKVVDDSEKPEPGGPFTYTLTITNTSVETVTITALTDTNALSAECLALISTSLAPGASTSCSYTVIHTDGGSYPNTASVTVVDDEDNLASDSDDETVTVTDVAPSVTIVKSADPATLPEPGGMFTFTLTITNTSVETVEITGLGDTNTLSDEHTPECKALVHTTLAPGQSVSCQYDITHTDAGTYPNTAEVTVADNEGNPAGDTDDETVTVTNVAPVVSVVKSVDVSSLPEPGGVFTFTLTITNDSNASDPLTITYLSDTQSSATDFSACGALVNMVLDPGESASCTYTVTHTDAGTYPNTASVTGTDDEGNEASDSDDETVTVENVNPVVSIVKSATPSSLPEPGGVFTFTLTITNDSNASDPFTITDLSDTQSAATDFSACETLVGAVLDPGESASCTYTVTHTDAGTYPNTATVTGTDDEGNEASDSDDEIVTVTDVLPTVQLIKDVTPATLPEPGGVFTFTLSITNTSVEAVTMTALTDDNALSAQCLALVGTTLAAGASTSCQYTVTHTDAGTYPNTASVTVKDNENNTASDTDNEIVTITDVAPSITVEKTANPTSVPETGGDVTFTYTITNNSVEPVEITSLFDDVFGPQAGDADCHVGILIGVGDSCTFSEIHFIDGDFESGIDHVNTFTAHAKDNENNDTSDDDDAIVTFTDSTADISITKVTVDGSFSGDGINILTGESIKWRYTVTNAGNYPLSNISVTDSVSGVTPAYISGDTNSNNKLDLSETWIFEASGTALTGNYSNTGTTSGSFTDGAGNVESDTASDGSSYFGADPQIAVTKVTVDSATAGDGLNILTGESIKWRYTVTNVGNVALSNVTVTDNKPGVTSTYISGDTNSNNQLDLSESWIFEASGTAVTGNYSNTGTASGSYTDSSTHTRTDTATDTSSYFGANPQIDIVKKTVGSDGTEGDNVFVLISGAVTWKYYVTNTGNVPLSNVTVTDNKPGVTVTCPKTTLAPNESMTCTATGTNNTPIGTWYNNTGTASGSYADSAGHTRTAPDSDASSYYSQNPGVVTNSSLCDFGTSFRLIFTPDVKYYTSTTPAYKLSDSNPGQFFYNVFQTGGTGTVTLTLPYPFITQGATPIHVYSSLTAAQANGQTCLQPTNEIKNYQTQVTLSSYPANNYAGTTTITLTGLPTSGFMYINIHLDYGLEKLNGWVKSGSNANYNLTINPTMPKVNIVNNMQHTFMSSIPNSTDSIFNTNEFKKVKGFGGLVKIKTGTVGGVDQFEGLEGATVQLWKGTTLLETMTTDVNGWYLSAYIHKGSAATYTVKVIANTGHVGANSYPYPTQSQSVSIGGSLKFGEGNFQISP